MALVKTDARGRISGQQAGLASDQLYEAVTHEDGTVVFTPVRVVPDLKVPVGQGRAGA